MRWETAFSASLDFLTPPVVFNGSISKPEVYVAFERIMVAAMHCFQFDAGVLFDADPLAYGSLVKKDVELTAFLRWLTLTLSQHLHAHHYTTGYGHIYHVRFKSFLIEQDQSLLNVIGTEERNS